MKRFNIYAIVSITILSFLLPACKDNVPSEEDIFYAEDLSTIQQLTQDGQLYTLNEFMDKYMSEKGNYTNEYTLYRTRAFGSGTIQGTDTLYLFSLDTIPSSGPGIYIMGRVATDDHGGNFYKSLVIQQMVDGQQQALRISVDAGSVSGMYPRGQMLLIRCNGLAIGRYANQPQLCVPSYNNNVFADRANQKIGWAPGRIPLARFKHATKYIGQPDESKLYYELSTIPQLTANFKNLIAARKQDGKLVKVVNIHYTGQCLSQQKTLMYCTTGNPSDDSNANVFAPTTGNVGYPQSRVIFDEEDEHYICVSMSEYAKQANYYLPGATSAEEGEVFLYDSAAVIDYSKPYLIANLSATYKNCIVPVSSRKEYQGWKVDDVVYTDDKKSKGYVCISAGNENAVWSEALGVVHCSDYSGSVQGVLSYYMDNAGYDPQATNWAISICDLSDLKLQKNGEPWVPLEYTPN